MYIDIYIYIYRERETYICIYTYIYMFIIAQERLDVLDARIAEQGMDKEGLWRAPPARPCGRSARGRNPWLTL